MNLPGHWLHELYTLLLSSQILFLLIFNTSITPVLKKTHKYTFKNFADLKDKYLLKSNYAEIIFNEEVMKFPNALK